ncbi:MAG: hypothetical protein IPK16_30755 [Anaerolineales bacterium]|nr:hypothetical protein [Anaerolineales bacterium]
MVAGSNLGTTPSAGFSGLTADATDGLRLFNVDLSLYDGSTLVVSLDKTLGLQFDEDTGALASEPRFIEWKTSLPGGTRTSVLASYTEAGPIGTVIMTRTDSSGLTRAVVQADNTGRTASIIVRRANATGPVTSVDLTGDTLTFAPGGGGASATGTVRLRARTSIADESGFAPVSIFHVKESTTATSTTAGATIEQGSTGDCAPVLADDGGRWVIGIDNSASDRFKISPSADLANALIAIDTSSQVGIGIATPCLSAPCRKDQRSAKTFL